MDLEKEVEDILRKRSSRKVYIPFYLMVFILIGAILYIKINNLLLNPIAIIAAVLFIIIILNFTEFHRLNNSYEINVNSLIHKKGILKRVTKNIDFLSISDIDVSQSLWQRLFNFGDVNVRLFSLDTTTSIKNISNPNDFAKFLESKIHNKRKGHHLGGGRGAR
jgi:uncharacterized membrane protein YdbT with pleckstrin-like domain